MSMGRTVSLFIAAAALSTLPAHAQTNSGQSGRAAVGPDYGPDYSEVVGPDGIGTARITPNSVVIRKTDDNPFGVLLPDRSNVPFAVGEYSRQTGKVEPQIVVLQDLRGNTMVIHPNGPGATLGRVRFNQNDFGEKDLTSIPTDNRGGDWQARYNWAKKSLNDLWAQGLKSRAEVETNRNAPLPDPSTFMLGHVYEKTLVQTMVGNKISLHYDVVDQDGLWHSIDARGTVSKSYNIYNLGDSVDFSGEDVTFNRDGTFKSRLRFQGDGQAFDTPFITRNLVLYGDEGQRYIVVSPNNTDFCNIPQRFLAMLNIFNLNITPGAMQYTYKGHNIRCRYSPSP